MPTMGDPVFCTIGRVVPAPPSSAPAGPESGALVIRGGYVLTMDPRSGDFPVGDVQIAGGQIVAAGPDLVVPPGTQELDAAGMIVAPGLVDTHWHMWNTLLRSMSAGLLGPPGPGYFPVMVGAGQVFGPDDIYQGTRMACAEAVSSGITTVHDWCHNVRGPAHAEAGLRALAEAGLRARFSYGCAAGHPNEEAMDLPGLERLHRDWDACSAGGRLSLGMAWRGPGGSNPAVRVPARVYRREIEAARALGIPVTVHACGPQSAKGQIDALARACWAPTCRWCTPTVRPAMRSQPWRPRARRSASRPTASCSSATGSRGRPSFSPRASASGCRWTPRC